MRRVIIAAVIIIFGSFLIYFFSAGKTPPGEELRKPYIVANPLDLETVGALTMYRSCAGHNYSGVGVEGGEEETYRSMKHYVRVKDSRPDIPVFAPFDGKISNLFIDRDGDQQVWITPQSNRKSPRQWHFVFFHVELNTDLKEGSMVKAGEKIGRAKVTKGQSFDIGMKYTVPFAKPLFDTPFYHMAPDVLAEYRAYGVTPENIIMSRVARDQNPCPLIAGEEGIDARFPPEASSNEQVILVKKSPR